MKNIDVFFKLYSMIKTSKFQVLIVILLVSCSHNATNESRNNDVLDRDTTIIYDLEYFSSQGAQSVVQYCSGIVKDMNLVIYSETEQSQIHYIFKDDSICVDEKIYRYTHSLENVKSQDDMHLESSNSYTIDAEGSLIEGDTLHNSINIFRDIQQYIPFVLEDK